MFHWRYTVRYYYIPYYTIYIYIYIYVIVYYTIYIYIYAYILLYTMIGSSELRGLPSAQGLRLRTLWFWMQGMALGKV